MFTWVFVLATKDETSLIFMTFITGIENQFSLKVKIIRSDNRTEFKNNYLNQFCGMEGIKREFSVPRTPQQNGIAKRKIKTLIEAARTMLVDSLLPISFWAKAVNTACYVQNRLRDNALVSLRQNLDKAEQEKGDLKLKLEKFQTSSKNLTELLASKTNAKTGLGYNSQVFTLAMFDCDDYISSESDESLPPSPIYDRYQSGNGYHAVPPPYTGTFMPPKPDLVFNTIPNDVETNHPAFNVKLSPTKPYQDLSHTLRPSAPIIEDWVFDYEDESETKTPQNVPSFVQPTEQVKSIRPSVQYVETSIPTKTAIPKPTSNCKRRNRKACFVCDCLIKDYEYHEKKMAQLTARNHAQRRIHKQYAPMTLPNPQRHVVPTAVLTQSKLVPITAVRPVSTAVPKISVTRPRQAKNVVTKPNSQPRKHINRSPSPKASNFPPKVTAVKAPMVNAAKELNGGYVAIGGNPKGGKISRKGKIRTGKLDFDDVYFVKELKFNLFSVSQMCDKKNSVLFIDTQCLVLSPKFKLPDVNQVLLRVPRENNMYNVNLKNIVPSGDLTCIFVKVTIDESNLWHRRLGHINFKTMNKLVKGNLVRGLPTKVFENDNTCIACKKGKQHRASYKTKPVSSINQPLYKLHMDLFGLTFVKSLNKKSYCLVITDDYSRFTWVFFLATKDVTSLILKNFITGLENQLSIKVKVTRSDNGTEFKNHDLNQFCGMKGIKREFSVPRTPQQNGIAERKNRTLIEAARTMLADSLLSILFWAEAVNTACYVQNSPESTVYVSPSSSAQTKKHDDKTKIEAKGKSPVESLTVYINLSAKFEDFSDNSINKVNAANSPAPAVGQISTNSTNTFRATGPSNATEERIDYDEVFAPVARIEAIRLFLAYASFIGFMVYQMDVKSAFLYGTIDEEVYVYQPPGLEDPDYPDKVYKVVKALYRLHQAPRA
nr:putative ribonuclease H-like domain-containing protein [Tanacetum cinerariifolium]